jgi:hypothetical protein
MWSFVQGPALGLAAGAIARTPLPAGSGRAGGANFPEQRQPWELPAAGPGAGPERPGNAEITPLEVCCWPRLPTNLSQETKYIIALAVCLWRCHFWGSFQGALRYPAGGMLLALAFLPFSSMDAEIVPLWRCPFGVALA